MSRPTIESHSARHPRLMVFYALIAVMLLTLISGMAYRQLFTSGLYSERERLQNQRRVIVPGPRGTIYDRNGKVLVGNRARFSVVLNLAELRPEFRAEFSKVLRAYRGQPREDRPTAEQLERIARNAVAQRYLDQINGILARHERVQSGSLNRHFAQTLLLPYILLDDLAPDEYARLIERIPVDSPLQVYASSTRHYPYASAAAHALGYVGIDNNPEAEEFPGDDLLTFKMKGSFGRDGIEKQFDAHLQGQAGGAIYRVDPAGFKVDLPIEKRLPVQGRNLTTSLDIDLQLAAERMMAGKVGAAVAMDVRTGEVLAMVSAPSYDLNAFVPRLGVATAKSIEENGAWLNRALQGAYATGSTFKIITAVAGLRAGAIDRTETHTICPGYLMVGNRRFPCNSRHGHGERDLVGAIRDSCNIFFYKTGVDIGPELLAAEARRFGYDRPTGIELPGETRRMLVGDPSWKMEKLKERWFPGDTANMSIGQGFLDTTPLQVAAFVASFARGETHTKPTILHVANRARQRSAPIGLSPADYAAVVNGMEQCVQIGTGRFARVDGLRIAAKTGTAQRRTAGGTIELAWMIAFAPVENPQIALAVILESQEVDANYGGGLHAAPVVQQVMKTWKEISEREPVATFQISGP
ncbi:MAG: penicillin-binding transpeptidase domain-containing protein [Candidatus Didemnitutus sp.]|nr:penicillin-binding transpeptidase domain-containing protein [Candidatus Didemnitutus sp.]